MYKINWGKVGEEILKKRPKITQMFDILKYPKVLKYQLKPLISLKFKKQSTHSHNPKVINSNLTPTTTEMSLLKHITEDFSLLGKIHLRPLKTIKIYFIKGK